MNDTMLLDFGFPGIGTIALTFLVVWISLQFTEDWLLHMMRGYQVARGPWIIPFFGNVVQII
jgi:hypothetical protein